MKRLLSVVFAFALLPSCMVGCKNKAIDTESSTDSTESLKISLEDPNGVVYESLAQKAVVKTALAYLARGTRIQYDDPG